MARAIARTKARWDAVVEIMRGPHLGDDHPHVMQDSPGGRHCYICGAFGEGEDPR
jgi:hypothetical protein